MKISDWIQIIATLFLGSVAIFGPIVTNWLRRPKLRIVYEQKEPYSVRAEVRSQIDPNVTPEQVYYFQLQIKNEGKTLAKYCEVLVEALWKTDAAGKPRMVTPFTPVSLIIQGATPVRPGGHLFVDINPKRTLLCALGHISSPSYQSREERNSFIPTPSENDNELRFLLDLHGFPFNQPNSFAKGTYIFQVSLYSENAGHCTVYLQLNWTGTWQSETNDMFREIVISEVSRPK